MKVYTLCRGLITTTVLCGVSLLGCQSIVATSDSEDPSGQTLTEKSLSGFYTIDRAVPANPGIILKREPLAAHQSLERANQNIRLLYSSTEGLFAKRKVAVSGALFLPYGVPPDGGWPLLGWAHGTVGIADHCAPSWDGRQDRDTRYLNFWLARGYAIVASDYQGLGTEGIHPYLATRPAAYSNLDIIRAVQQGGFPVSSKVVLIGQSQGAGAALATAGYAPEYAPELDIRGVVVTGAPYFNAEGLAAVQASRPKDVVDPLLAYNFLALSLLELIDAEFQLQDYVSDEVLPVARLVHSMCYKHLIKRVGEERISYNKAFKVSPARALVKAFKQMEYPSLVFNAPVFFGIGGKDKSTPPKMQYSLVRDICAGGSPAEVHYYPDGTHGSIVNGSTGDSTVFIESVFDDQSIVGNCASLPFE